MRPLLFEKMVGLHNRFYIWNEKYEDLIKSKTWHSGFLTAKKAIGKVKAFPWKTVQEHRKAILKELSSAKKSHPSA